MSEHKAPYTTDAPFEAGETVFDDSLGAGKFLEQLTPLTANIKPYDFHLPVKVLIAKLSRTPWPVATPSAVDELRAQLQIERDRNVVMTYIMNEISMDHMTAHQACVAVANMPETSKALTARLEALEKVAAAATVYCRQGLRDECFDVLAMAVDKLDALAGAQQKEQV